ncbi:MAG: response regulator [Hungatella sp.]|jgi:two-component system sensor histidine kinase/response regulator|nr:response regulator [Hungatella sp.]
MKNRITRFLITSAAAISVLCLVVFSFLAYYMNKQSGDTITAVGTIYMTGMNDRISMHFRTTIEMRLTQVEELVEEYPPEGSGRDGQGLAYGAKARGFNHLASCSGDGRFEMFFGSPVKVTDPEPFLQSIQNNEKKIAVGTDEDGNHLILMAVPAGYDMSDGQKSKALVAGLSVDYIKDILSLDENNTLVYSHIIRKDGSFVIRSAGAFRDTYFHRIRELFTEMGADDAERCVKELQSAMEENRDYSSILELGTERRHLYCAKLPYSEWYLVTVMPYGTLDATVGQLNDQWGYMVAGSCGVVLAALLLVFLRYFGLNKQQLAALEDARKEAVAANKAKSEFLSNMSHDIRTPMNAIVGMTAIASANLEDGERVRNCLRKITMSSKHLLGLINDVLDMSKIESGKMTLNMEQVSLREVMDSIVNIVQPQVKAKNQQFEVQIYDIAAENVYCDSVRLNQVLLNLLSNAIKFTPDGGLIIIAMYQEESPLGDGYVRNHIIVEDTGIGMSETFRKRVFESFVREDNARVNKTEGTGLGMAITKYIVDAMKGSIEVTSQQGKGTRFHVTLEMEKADVEEVDMILPDWNMLVVDDDQLLCESTVASLLDIGIKAEWTQDGESALELVRQRRREHRDFQIILLDWKLPGIDGIETARRINKILNGDIPIILISAYDWNDIEKEAKEAGISGFISKPLFKSTLFYGLRQHMGWREKAKEEETQQAGALEGYRVLLAEDNELNWEIASELLSEEGLKLDWAEDGRACVDMFVRSQPGYYDAILMDIRMPVMNGYEAARAIRELDREDKDVPIIAMTADAFSEDIKKCLECGMNAHVAKPIDIKEVSRILMKYINMR